MKKFVSWRKSFKSKSKISLDSQKRIIDYFVKLENGELVADYEEVCRDDYISNYSVLNDAIDFCKKNTATLIIAQSKLFNDMNDAISFYDTMGENNIYICNLPDNKRTTLIQSFGFAEREALLVSIVTKYSLDAKKSRGETWDRKGYETIYKAQMVSRYARTTRAKEDATNVFFKEYTEAFEERNGITFKYGTDMVWYKKLAEELSNLGNKTKTGKEYTAIRCRALVERFKRRYGTWQDHVGEKIISIDDVIYNKINNCSNEDCCVNNMDSNNEEFKEDSIGEGDESSLEILIDDNNLHDFKQQVEDVPIKKEYTIALSDEKAKKTIIKEDNYTIIRKYIDEFEKRNNIILRVGVSSVYFEMLSDELNRKCIKTNTGLFWNKVRVYSFVRFLKLKYGLQWDKSFAKKKSFVETQKQSSKSLSNIIAYPELNDDEFTTIEAEQLTKNCDVEQIPQESKTYIEIDKQKLESIKRETAKAQTILSEIYAEDVNNEDDFKIVKENNQILSILKSLFEKEKWLYSEVEKICKRHNVMIGSAVEQINDYAFYIVGDSVVEDDGEYINVMTEYKDNLGL